MVLTVRILGGGLDVGRSCILITLGHRNVLLDVGAHPAYADGARRLPDFSALPVLDAVLVTHFHLDHAGALPALHDHLISTSASPIPPVVMTAPTRALSALMLADFHATSVARGQPAPFRFESIAGCLSSVTDISPEDLPYSPPTAPDLSISAHYAGHVLGAVMFSVTLLGHATVVYSGDYSTTPDRHLRSFQIPVFPSALRPDLFITEATYCGTLRSGIGGGASPKDGAFSQRSRVEADLVAAVLRAVRVRGKVLIPVAALGRARELIAVLAMLWADHDLSHVPVYVAAGLMAKAAPVFEAYAGEWCVPASSSSDGDDHDADYDHGAFPALREFNRAQDWDRVTDEGPMVMLATPGNLSTGLSLDVFRVLCGDERNVVVVPGYCFANTLAARLLSGRDDGVGMNIRCSLVNMSFSAHADARGITRTVRRLEPRVVMLVHGNEAKIKAFQPILFEALGASVPVYAPANGTELDLSTYLRSDKADRFPHRTGTKRRARIQSDGSLVVGYGDVDVNTKEVGDDENIDAENDYDDIPLGALEADWHLAVERYKRGAGMADRRVLKSGSASRPVVDGVATISRLYALLSPEAELVGRSATHLRYKECVDVWLDRTAVVVNVSWNHRDHARDARLVLDALDDASSPPSSPG
jgi:integrator complex subunit 11